MPEEMDPADALALLLAQRERAKKAVYNIAIAKEQTEKERDEWATKYAGAKTALDLALFEKNTVIAEMETLKDKERARSEIIDALTSRTDEAEKRVKILEAILGRVENELYTAIEEEDEFVPLEEVVKGADLAEKHDNVLYGAAAVPLESSTTYPGPLKRDRVAGWLWGQFHRAALAQGNPWGDRIKAVVFSKSMALATLVAAPFIAMSVFGYLATQGIYVDFIRALWEQTPWLSDAFKNSLVAWSPVIAFQLFIGVFLFRWAFPWANAAKSESSETVGRESGSAQQGGSPKGDVPATAAAKPAAPEADTDSYDKILGELFGEDDTDA